MSSIGRGSGRWSCAPGSATWGLLPWSRRPPGAWRSAWCASIAIPVSIMSAVIPSSCPRLNRASEKHRLPSCSAVNFSPLPIWLPGWRKVGRSSPAPGPRSCSIWGIPSPSRASRRQACPAQLSWPRGRPCCSARGMCACVLPPTVKFICWGCGCALRPASTCLACLWSIFAIRCCRSMSWGLLPLRLSPW